MFTTISIAIVEDDRHYNNALKKIIDYDSALSCVGQFYNGYETLRNLVGISPDIVLIDIKLPDKTGIELVSELKPIMEKTQFIMCTSFEDDKHIFDALKAGASGYLAKGESLQKIIASIKECHSGGAPMSFGIANRVLQFFRQEDRKKPYLEELTKTENEVLEMLSRGMLYKEIADQKNVSIDTIKKQAGSIYRKLHVCNKTEAINKLNNN
ncbi:response regulator transcription factor [Moheibacter sediminis]|uniref:Two component transcriptional regulator, LuxR family n=1 Tax=Moheibacter sediminis TaxID=1434700 RepID=A0A1W1Y9S4_9FLAO|nr:response regulator transcription factor [Moheibacter sediminis]SMC32896.1 two component transcriptional regulator, LuxR family [Moheibacter sediminis]